MQVVWSNLKNFISYGMYIEYLLLCFIEYWNMRQEFEGKYFNM